MNSKISRSVVVVMLSLLIVSSFSVIAAAQKTLSIAAVDFPQFQPYKVRTEASMQAAEEFGVEYTLLPPTEPTVEAAVEGLLNAINQDFDAIICEPWSYEPWLEAIDRANEKGIPLVNVHVPYKDHEKFISQVYIDNEGYGKTAADILAKEFDGKANILIMMNNPDVANQAVQRQTFIDYCAEKYPGMKVVATEFTQVNPIIAVERLEAAFTAYPEIDTVLFLESATVTMAADVAKEMGILDKIRIIGIDDPPDLITSIKNGEVWGSFNQNFQKQGYEAIRNIVDHFAGNPFPHQTDAGIVLITQENVDNYLPEMWAPVAMKDTPYPNLK